LVHALAGGLFGGSLGGEGCSLTGALETHRSGAGGGDHVALRVGEAHQRIVERGVEVSRAKLLEVLLENKEKIVKLSKERYNIDVENVISKIIFFLEDKK